MQKLIFLLLSITPALFISQTQDKLEKAGYYENNVQTRKISSASKEIVFIPMKHFGTEEFYADVMKSIDSLKNKGFYFLYEKVEVDTSDTTAALKYKKIVGAPLSRNSSYIELLKNNNISFKKPLIDQPSYEQMGLSNTNSSVADATAKELVLYFEQKYGAIDLNDCEKKSSLFEADNCNGKKIKAKQKDEVLINYRNAVVINKLLKNSGSKVAIIYGAAHIDHFIKELKKEL